MPRTTRARGLLAALLIMLLTACGEPPVALDVPPRGPDQHILDTVGVVDAALEADLRALSASSGLDVVALAFEDKRTSLGQADRGGKLLLREWDADIVLVAVAAPGDFGSTEADRRRFFGVFASDRFAVSRSLRERIIFERVQLLAADNAWADAFAAAADELATELADREG
jgi:hypothetical protein